MLFCAAREVPTTTKRPWGELLNVPATARVSGPFFPFVVSTAPRALTELVATLNIDLRVGELAETITVSGETPIVNLQSAAQQRVMTEEIVTQLPTARSIQGLATLIPGVKIISAIICA